jgi:D-glycero-beta-D-manno-heptose 1-phosphate adenylyltransferase
MKKLDIIDNKIIAIQQLPSKLSYWRFLGKKIVFTNGCFDIVHLGHIDYLSKAADLGDILLVGLNTDQSVRRIKGSGRPINDESARAKLLASFFFVSGVVMFEEDTPYELISVVKPDVLVKGSDYRAEDIVGYDIVTQHGGKVITLDFLPGYSTTAIANKLTKQ